MPEQVQDLRELMVIRKARNPNPVISTKSMLIFAVTWSLWLLTAYLIVNNHRSLLFNPIVGNRTLIDLVKAAAVVVLAQLNLLLAWSVCISRRRKH
ncbi:MULTISPECIES: hypothetical protein [Neisseria]|uniref:Uncharacterized protein n=1 Tax=Neisseria musculi TaxID=1815583 RepID=A0A7H1MFC3_9NEIS|nr:MULTISPECIES: hypothetical protein [Neisseria]MBF0804513.1 hypothetical protein [Neisseria sp. 19428wB4_WF04]QNT60338.1 hypothetical protein H7A79_2329 [Neisseria musculi]TFU40490.1 hypothetical protein E4T99_09185 [Neisseria sp. WF04]